MTERKNTCRNCRWWHQKQEDGMRYGLCRRFPPQFSGGGSFTAPYTHPFDWCGEWQPPEQPDNPQDRSASDG